MRGVPTFDPCFPPLQGVMNNKLQCDLETRNVFFRAILPTLAHFCTAFPLLLEGCMDLLLRVCREHLKNKKYEKETEKND